MSSAEQNGRAPADQDVRRRVVHDLDTSFFLEAGAGAGKTRVMVERIIETVRRGKAELREIVGITFTEKAAGELRARVRRGLTDALAESVDADERERLRAAQEQVDAAHIETIHAFASSLLHERPFEARLDPYFGVLDQLGQTLDLEEAWNDWIWSELDSSHAASLEEVLSYGLDVAHIREAAEQVSRYRDLSVPADGDGSGGGGDPRETLERWIADAQRVADAYAEVEDKPDALSRTAALLEGLRALRDSEGDAKTLARRMAQFAADESIRPPRKYKRNAEARELWDEAALRRGEFADAVRRGALGRLLGALGHFVEWHAERRRRRLSFDDLLLYARDLIREQPPARRHFRERYKTLLIDEFQDTDPLQAELVLLLASAEDTNDWRKARPAAGKLFMVGDPKQSIYRFRRADIGIFQQVRRLFEETAAAEPGSAAVERLGVNFRSRANLAEWANSAFPEILRREEDYPSAQAEYGAPIAAHRAGGGAGVAVVESPQLFDRVAEAREAEAELLPRMIHALTEDRAGFGQLPCGVCAACDANEVCAAPRAPRMDDIAVLVRSRTEIDRYTNAFDVHGIPYHLDSGRGFFTRPEVRDLTNILMAVDDPTDEVAVMSALKTPLASASDQELFDYVYCRSDGPRSRFTLDAGAVPDEYEGPLRDGFERLRALREGLRNRSLPQFVEFVLRESQLLDAQFAHGTHGDDRAANLLMLVHRAADFVEAADDSLRPFVQWLAQRRGQDLSEAESATSEHVDNVVRVLTIHQAKGLEFPIVIVPKLGDGTRDTTRIMVDRERDTFEIQVGAKSAGFHTAGFDPEREAAYSEAESRRLLYVAATRAEDWLVLPHYLSVRSSGATFASFLEESLATASPDHVIAVGPDQFDAFEAAKAEPIDVPHEAIVEGWRTRREAALTAGTVDVETVAPSAGGHDAEKAARESGVAQDDDDDAGPAARGEYVPPASVRSDALRRGKAVHRALELADLDDPERSAATARRVADEYGLAPEELAGEVLRTLGTDLMRRAASAQERHFELPLVQAVGGAGDEATKITEGIADLAFREADGWVVVDFKSDRSVDAEREQRYRAQVGAYARILAAAGEPVREAWLLYTYRGTQKAVPLDTSEAN